VRKNFAVIVRLFFAAMLSAVLLLAWSFLFWTVFGASTHLMVPLPSENHLIAELREFGIASGMYLYPVPVDTNNQEATEVFNQQHRDGPLLQLAYKADGGLPCQPNKMSHVLPTTLPLPLLPV
jgi:hypothetical protein